jgi:hypothetical protein
MKKIVFAIIVLFNHGYILAQDKANENYCETLRRYSQYSDSGYISVPDYTYQSSASLDLINLKQKYNLDSVAGNGNEVTRIINLMKWTHNVVLHSSTFSGDYPGCMSASCLIEYSKTNKIGLPCYFISLILNDIYLSMGFRSKYVFCLPDETDVSDNHVINIVYSETLKKWVWIDPTFEVYVMDENQNMLNVYEVRQGLIKNQKLVVSEGVNLNGKTVEGSTWYLNYMSKNLFRFIVPINSQTNYESSNMPSYIELIPLYYNPEKAPIGAKIDKGTGYKYYTNNEKQFWR